MTRLRDRWLAEPEGRRSLLRSGAITALKAAKIQAPARVVDSFLHRPEASDALHEESGWRTYGGGVVDLVRQGDALRFVVADVEGPRIVTDWSDRATWPADALPWPCVPSAQAVETALTRTSTVPFDDLVALVSRHVVLPGPQGAWAALLAAWVMGTYLLDLFPYFPLVLLEGPPERGKTRLAKTLLWPAFRGMYTPSPTPATLFRDRAHHRLTLALDVEDLRRVLERGGDLADLILNSFERDGTVRRCTRPDAPPPLQVEEFRTFGPTILITNKPVRETSPLASRCLRVNMPEAGRQVVPDALTPEGALSHRVELIAWAAQTVSRADPLPRVENPFSGRLRDLAMPILQVLALVAPDRIELVCELLSATDVERRSEASRAWEARVAMALPEGRASVEAGRLYVRDIERLVNEGLSSEDPDYMTAQRVGVARHALGLSGGRGGAGGRAYVIWPGDEQARALHDRYAPREEPGGALRVVRVLSDQDGASPSPAEDPLKMLRAPAEVLSVENPHADLPPEDPDDPEGSLGEGRQRYSHETLDLFEPDRPGSPPGGPEPGVEL